MDIQTSRDIKVVLHGRFEGMGKMEEDEFYIPYSLIEKAYLTEKEWVVSTTTLKVHVTKAKVSEITNYDYKGNYLHYNKNSVENWNVVFDKTGIPQTKYSFGTFYNPSTISQYGLQHYSLFLINQDKQSKDKFLKVANWLVDNQDGSGGWAYQFDHHFFPGRLDKLKAPWYSAIGMGMALSVLSRAFYLTKDRKYTACALNGLSIFKTPVNSNGILARFENKYDYYEECPTEPASFILNGFMFSLIGLYDFYKTTNNNDALRLYRSGIVSLKRMLPLYDLGNRTAYDLTHYTTDGGYPNVAKWGYHVTHIHLLAAINSVEKDKKMDETLARWKGYLAGKSKPAF
ncbi:D-glucuronyl C5-epimerase family protein [Mesobacillus foraminis]|uniref:D-glucuronyl C5-epimerase family protein n=1 Tax=Mesobacillus foraminis TaxID=279826 RepID=UPI001BEA8B9F|nr:D-glucuronyl C5-epimerase family protein [Mesobacillus foraminis]MBT2756348.1 D-glucuronyl C5-epimerase family protein [Mesobacillus foraminis]